MIKKEKKTVKAACFSLHLSLKEYEKLTELTQVLNMSKHKVISKLLVDRADLILCNAPEILRKLDTIGYQLAAADQKIASMVSQTERNCSGDNHASVDQQPAMIPLIHQSENLRHNIDNSFREILSLLKKMT